MIDKGMENFKEAKHWLNNEIVALEVACLMKALVLSFIGPGIFQGGGSWEIAKICTLLSAPLQAALMERGSAPCFSMSLLGKILPAGDKITA